MVVLHIHHLKQKTAHLITTLDVLVTNVLTLAACPVRAQKDETDQTRPYQKLNASQHLMQPKLKMLLLQTLNLAKHNHKV